MKKSLVLLISIFCVVMLLEVQTAFSEMTNYELEQEVKELKEKFGTLGVFKKLSERLSFSGLIEVEASATDGYGGEDESDIVLATVELGLDAQIADWVNGHILLLWEEDDTEPVDLDEGTITLGNPDKFPLYLTVGKMYVPFGNFESNMIQDPLTLEIGETRESAAQVGFEHSGFYGSFYTFNGDIDENGEDNEIKCYGANAGYAFESDAFNIDVGAGWINNIADTDGLGDEYASLTLKDYEGGFSVYAIAAFGSFTVIGEYVGASDDIEFTTETRQDPSAWNIEVGFTFEAMGRETCIAAGYQGTDSCGGMLPENRYLGTVSIALCDYVGLAMEYFHDEDYDINEGGTEDDADTITLQLAVEF